MSSTISTLSVAGLSPAATVVPRRQNGSEIALTTFAGILTIILMTAPEAYAGTWQAVEAGL